MGARLSSCLLLFQGVTALFEVQLPPYNQVQVEKGNSTYIVHRTWFNETQGDLSLYLGFDNLLFQISGSFLGGDLQVTYRTTCDVLSCLGPSPVLLPVGDAARCQTIEATVRGTTDTNGSNISFRLFDRRNLLQFEEVRTTGIHVIEPNNLDSITTEPQSTDVTTTIDMTDPTTGNTPSQPETTTDDTTVGNEKQEGQAIASSRVTLYVTTGIFFFMAGINMVSVLFLVVWNVKRSNMGMMYKMKQTLIGDGDSRCDLCYEMPDGNGETLSHRSD